jgi:UDP-N-acetylglucosamine--N-acetylmuramyl-(pentapeptide) pyrophosphoryl-undecaprenol N-acetylglucosamine transferase
MKILVTGGHITPALAVIEELRKIENIQISVVGRNDSFEYQSIHDKNIKFIYLEPGRLTRVFTFKSLINILRFPVGIIQAIAIVHREKPDKIVSFGGYIAFSIALAAYIFGIPVYTHEQTLIPGMTNSIIARFAKKVFISFPESASYFKRKTVLTGNPIRTNVFNILHQINIPEMKKPVIYVTGGSMGSHALNLHIENILPKLLETYTVIHQTGSVEKFNDFGRLSEKGFGGYFVFKHIHDNQIGYIYSISDIVVCRSGANTITELIALKKPSVLVPLPWAARDEQRAQAKFMHDKGVAEIFEQSSASETLLSEIKNVSENKEKYRHNFSKLETYYHPKAAATIAHEILS